MKIEVSRAEFFSSIGRNRDLVGQHPVLVVEDLQRARIFRLGRGAFIAAGHQDRQPIVGRHAYLMRVDAGVDLARLLDFFAGREVRVDAIDPHRTRIVERHQNKLRRNICADVYRSCRQPDRRAVRRQGAGRRVDRQRGDVVLGPLSAGAGSTVAARNIEIAPRSMRPGILHTGWQGDRLALHQLASRDIYVVMRQIGPDIGIERDFLRCRRLGGNQSRRRNAARGKCHQRSPAEHVIPPADRCDLIRPARPGANMWTARLVAPRAGRRFLLCTLFSWLGNGGGRQRESEGAQIRVSSKRRQRWSKLLTRTAR